ncbi:MAG: heavy metal translocating P-type ATPase, partial [Daejeonella sp.]
DGNDRNFNDTIAKYFSMVTLMIAFTAAGYWAMSSDSDKAWNAFTAVLIVACPCVLALSTPFTLSSVLAIFDRNQFYLRSTDVVEQLAKVDTIVFDKTGTLTSPETAELSFSSDLSDEEKILTASLARNSIHPLSLEIIRWVNTGKYLPVSGFTEIPGKGIHGVINQQMIRMGSAFLKPAERNGIADIDSSAVHLEIDGTYKGYFKIKQSWRAGLKTLFNDLSKSFDLHLLSGDNEAEKENLSGFFPSPHQMRFRQSPHNKLEYIRDLQSSHKTVMMLGDGLNDAGALKQSDLGVAVTDNINNFSPACDAILSGNSSGRLPAFIGQAKDAVRTIKMSFAISASYNLIGVYFAVQGLLLPLLAAVLMPLSTITIIVFTSVITRYFAGKNKLL